MSYWCDDYELAREQRKLDAMQSETAQGIEARQRQDATRLDPKDESPTPKGVRP